MNDGNRVFPPGVESEAELEELINRSETDADVKWATDFGDQRVADERVRWHLAEIEAIAQMLEPVIHRLAVLFVALEALGDEGCDEAIENLTPVPDFFHHERLSNGAFARFVQNSGYTAATTRIYDLVHSMIEAYECGPAASK